LIENDGEQIGMPTLSELLQPYGQELSKTGSMSYPLGVLHALGTEGQMMNLPAEYAMKTVQEKYPGLANTLSSIGKFVNNVQQEARPPVPSYVDQPTASWSQTQQQINQDEPQTATALSDLGHAVTGLGTLVGYGQLAKAGAGALSGLGEEGSWQAPGNGLVYHGSDVKNIKNFKTGTGLSDYGTSKGVYTTTDIDRAKSFGNNVYRLSVNEGNYIHPGEDLTPDVINDIKNTAKKYNINLDVTDYNAKNVIKELDKHVEMKHDELMQPYTDENGEITDSKGFRKLMKSDEWLNRPQTEDILKNSGIHGFVRGTDYLIFDPKNISILKNNEPYIYKGPTNPNVMEDAAKKIPGLSDRLAKYSGGVPPQ
jgi:hypothetical protein